MARRQKQPAGATPGRRHPWRRPAVLAAVAAVAVYTALALPEPAELDHPIRNPAGQVVGYHHGVSVAQVLCWAVAVVFVIVGGAARTARATYEENQP